MGKYDYQKYKIIGSHRCEGSLKNGISVRLLAKRNYLAPGLEYCAPGWTVGGLEYDSEDTKPLWHEWFSAKFCPFCGDKLDE